MQSKLPNPIDYQDHAVDVLAQVSVYVRAGKRCQTNSNQSQFAAVGVNLCGTKLTPLGKCGCSVEFEIVT